VRLERLELLDVYARALPERLMRLVGFPLARHMNTADAMMFESARMVNVAFAYTHGEGLAGDYFEFGVYRGRTFVEAWKASERYGGDRRLHALDSFAGLPGSEGPFRQGDLAASREAFEKVLRANRVPSNAVTITEGFFEDTLADADPLPDTKAAIAWVDCDLYESTVPVLRYLTGKLVDGAVLVFDDWYFHHADPARGEQRACREWLADNPGLELVPYRPLHWAGQSFIVRRAPSA